MKWFLKSIWDPTFTSQEGRHTPLLNFKGKAGVPGPDSSMEFSFETNINYRKS